MITMPSALLMAREVQAGVGAMSRIRRLWQDSPRREMLKSRRGCGRLFVSGWRCGLRVERRGSMVVRRVSIVLG